MTDETLLTVGDLAVRYQVREGTVRRWLADGRVPGARRQSPGRGPWRWVVPEPSLVDWVPPGEQRLRHTWSRDQAGRLRQVETERDLWRDRAEIARLALERIAHGGGRFDTPQSRGWQRAARIAQRALEQISTS